MKVPRGGWSVTKVFAWRDRGLSLMESSSFLFASARARAFEPGAAERGEPAWVMGCSVSSFAGWHGNYVLPWGGFGRLGAWAHIGLARVGARC